jgi:membrane fusion protein (multidrug efflux system)
MKRWMRWTLPVLAALTVAAVATRVVKGRQADAAAAGAAARPASGAASGAAPQLLELAAADVLTLAVAPLSRTLDVSGSLRAVNSAFVKARVAAELQTLTVREGDSVKRGQLLGQLDATEFDLRLRQADQQAAAAKAQVDMAQRTLVNNQALVAQGFISTTALDTALSTEAGAQATLQAALAAVDLARKAKADTTLTAPIAGLVSQRLAQPGERVPIDAKIIEIVDLGQLELEAAIAPQDASALRVGASASLSIDGSAEPLTARVVRINPSAQAGSRTVTAYLAVQPHPSLRQGLFARGAIELARQNALALPLSAVRTDQAQPYVVRITNDRAEQRVLTLGARGQAVQHLDHLHATGLAAGDRVLAASAGLVSGGVRLRIAAGLPASAALPATAASAAAAR